MLLVNTEIAKQYQGLFNLLTQEHGLDLTISEMDEIITEAQKIVKEENKSTALLATRSGELLNYLERHYRYLNLDDQQKAKQLIDSCRLP